MQTTTWNIETYRKAWAIATKYHDGQKYGGPLEGQQIEYLNHIGSVASEVMNALQFEKEVDPNLALACALLHDIIEDTNYSEAELKNEFGQQVYQGVMALTKNEQMASKVEMMQDSLDRILQQPKEIAMVKLSDRICNLSEPPYYWNKEKMKSYLLEAQLILDNLGGRCSYLRQRLTHKITEYQEKYID